jgi:hypothetical protein
MSDRGLEDHWRIMTVGSASQINDRDRIAEIRRRIKQLASSNPAIGLDRQIS